MSESFATTSTVARHALLSMRFGIQEYWSGLSFPSPGDLPNSGIKPMSPALAGRFFASEPPGKHIYKYKIVIAVQSPSCVRFFTTSWTATSQSSLYLTNSWNLPTFMSIEPLMPYNHLILWSSLLLLHSIVSTIRVFSIESADQNIGASASVLSMIIHFIIFKID